MAEIKTIVRGDSYRGSNTSYASSRFAPKQHHTATSNSTAAAAASVTVARSNSLRQGPTAFAPAPPSASSVKLVKIPEAWYKIYSILFVVIDRVFSCWFRNFSESLSPTPSQMSVSIQRPSILSTDPANARHSPVNNGGTSVRSPTPTTVHHSSSMSPLSHSNPGYAPLSTVNRPPDPIQWSRQNVRSPTSNTTTPTFVAPSLVQSEAAAYRPSSQKDSSNVALSPSNSHQQPMQLAPTSPTPQPRLSHEQVHLLLRM